tara:strand:+ start:213 stop:476 length:264 start_codon:yes stop_codon:yes gene_type:complete
MSEGSKESVKITFEQAQTELEEIVRTLEKGELSLERTLELWERGEELHTICIARLDAAEGRIEELTQELKAPEKDREKLSDTPDTNC